MLRAAEAYYLQQRRYALVAIAAAKRSWSLGTPRALLPTLTLLQGYAARDGVASVAAMLAEQNIDAPPAGDVNTGSLVGTASDGRPLGSLLEQASTAQTLELMAVTQVADMGRIAAGLAITARPNVGGYVRMLSPPSCSRCVILAGKFFKWNSGFNRHPGCDCRHIPASEDTVGDLRTDPAAYFRSLDPAEQDRVFTKAGAQAIRDGADMNQIVNARRVARGLTPAGGRYTLAEQKMLRGGKDRGSLERVDVFGHQVFITSEGITRRGIAGRKLGAWKNGERLPGSRYATARTPRLMPESIYELAKDRADAIRLLQRFGYVL